MCLTSFKTHGMSEIPIFDVLQIDFVLCDHELESQKETVIHLIVAYHGYKGFGLVVYLWIATSRSFPVTSFLDCSCMLRIELSVAICNA